MVAQLPDHRSIMPWVVTGISLLGIGALTVVGGQAVVVVGERRYEEEQMSTRICASSPLYRVDKAWIVTGWRTDAAVGLGQRLACCVNCSLELPTDRTVPTPTARTQRSERWVIALGPGSFYMQSHACELTAVARRRFVLQSHTAVFGHS